MGKFSELDLGSTILSIAVAAGFVACGLVILRLVTSALKSLITKFLIKDQTSNNTLKENNGKKGFN